MYMIHDLTTGSDIEEIITNFMDYMKNPIFPHTDIDTADYLRNSLKGFKENLMEED